MAWADGRPLPATPKPPEHQQQADLVQAQIRADILAGRRSLFKPPPAAPALSDNVLDERIAEELDLVSRQMGQVADVLSDDPILVSRYGAQLQSIDLMQQVLGNLGRVVASADKPMAVEGITMSDLQARLKRKALRGIAD